MIVSGSVLNLYTLSFPLDQNFLGSVKCFEKHIPCNGHVLAEFSQSAVLVSYAKKTLKF